MVSVSGKFCKGLIEKKKKMKKKMKSSQQFSASPMEQLFTKMYHHGRVSTNFCNVNENFGNWQNQYLNNFKHKNTRSRNVYRNSPQSY